MIVARSLAIEPSDWDKLVVPREYPTEEGPHLLRKGFILGSGEQVGVLVLLKRVLIVVGFKDIV